MSLIRVCWEVKSRLVVDPNKHKTSYNVGANQNTHVIGGNYYEEESDRTGIYSGP